MQSHSVLEYTHWQWMHTRTTTVMVLVNVCMPAVKIALFFLHSHRTWRQVKASAAKQSIQSGGFDLAMWHFQHTNSCWTLHFLPTRRIIVIPHMTRNIIFALMAELDRWQCSGCTDWSLVVVFLLCMIPVFSFVSNPGSKKTNKQNPHENQNDDRGQYLPLGLFL